MDVAISMELAENEARKLKADVQDVHEPESIHKVTVRNKPCYRCGKTNHIPDKCFIKAVNVTHVMKWDIYRKCVQKRKQWSLKNKRRSQN